MKMNKNLWLILALILVLAPPLMETRREKEEEGEMEERLRDGGGGGGGKTGDMEERRREWRKVENKEERREQEEEEEWREDERGNVLKEEEEEGGGGGGQEERRGEEVERRGRRRQEEAKRKRKKDIKHRKEKEEEEEEEEAWVWVINKEETTRTRAIQRETIDVTGGNLTLEIRTQTHTLTLDVYANRELLGRTYTGQGGRERHAVCEYLGRLRGHPASLVAVSVCGGLWGVVYTGGQWLEITPAPDTHTLAGLHLLHRHRHARPHAHGQAGTCGVRGVAKQQKQKQQQQEHVLRRGRRSLRGDYLWVQPNTSFVEVVVVVDQSLRQQVTEASTTPGTPAEEMVKKRVQSIMNIVNALYRQLGVIIVLTHVEIWTKNKVEVVDKDSNATLTNFKGYLNTFKEANPTVPMDNIQLLTGVNFEGNTVGKGVVGGMCGPASVGVSMDGTTKSIQGLSSGLRSILGVAHTMTHEMGHNFGLSHVDEVDGCECEDKDCIMLSSTMGTEWDECSKTNVSRLLQTVAMDCLKNRPEGVEELGSCGDGVVQEGEECDCGPPQYCSHACCDPATCKLAGNATCGSGACCDLKTCQPYSLSPAKECRPAHSVCDLPEYCDGSSQDCPYDYWAADGTACEVGKGFCYQGACGSAWGRCKQLWGDEAEPCTVNQQTTYNQLGTTLGNCGYKDEAKTELKQCRVEDGECGTLFCVSPKNEDKLGSFFTRTSWVSAVTCRAVMADPSYDQSAWLVPNGAACGDGKMCVNQHCVSRPTRLSTILFWLFLVIGLILTLLCWDHFRYCWERQGGRNCCTTHCFYCAQCLDACCCPCMNRLNRIVLSVLPPLRCPCLNISRYIPRFNIPSQASGKDDSGATPNGDAVCNGGGPAGGAEGVRAAGNEQEGGKAAGTSKDWDVNTLVGAPTKGVTFKPVTSPPKARGHPQGFGCEVPLLDPLFDAPQPPPPTGNPGNEEYVNMSQFEQGDLGQSAGTHTDTQTHIAPVRPAPPPPGAHTDTHVHRPTPSIPPRPVITHPLRPTLPTKPNISSPPPNFASFPPPPPPPPHSSSSLHRNL